MKPSEKTESKTCFHSVNTVKQTRGSASCENKREQAIYGLKHHTEGDKYFRAVTNQGAKSFSVRLCVSLNRPSERVLVGGKFSLSSRKVMRFITDSITKSRLSKIALQDVGHYGENDDEWRKHGREV